MLNIRPKRILYRIIIPFTILFGLTTFATWFFSASFITRYLDQNLKRQMEQVTGVISESRYVLNPIILQQLKEVIQTEIVLFDREGRRLTSTFSDSRLLDAVSIHPEDIQSPSLKGKDIQLGERKYRILIRPLSLGGQGGAFLSLWAPTDDMDSLRRRMIVSIGGIALVGIFSMALIGYAIARSITSPLEELVKVTARVSEGDLSKSIRLDRDDEIGKLSEAFNQMIDRLKDSEERLVRSEKLATAGRMAAGLAHEIRNPLTSIKMLGQVLHRRMKDQTESQEMLNSLVREIDRVDRIIQEMIDRTRSGKLKKQRGDINQLIKEVVRVAEAGIMAENISIQQNLSNRLPNIDIDQERIKQVLWNLILNAKEAMPGGGELILSTEAANGGLIEITIEDTGRGIMTDDAERLFQPFFTTKPEGFGLGLSMSRKIVEQHGGELMLSNRSGGGVEARIILPVSTNQPEDLSSEAEKRA